VFSSSCKTQPSAKAADERKADREAISAVLNSQQAAWNRGDVDAFLVGYWRSPELTFSGSSGVARGWEGVLARYKKSLSDKGAMDSWIFRNWSFVSWDRMRHWF